jgi:hypothetical protein
LKGLIDYIITGPKGEKRKIQYIQHIENIGSAEIIYAYNVVLNESIHIVKWPMIVRVQKSSPKYGFPGCDTV